MAEDVSRRTFIAAGAAAAAGLVGSPTRKASAGQRQVPGLKKALIWGMLPGSLSVDDRCKLARDVGFDGIEIPPVSTEEAATLRAAAAKAGIRIHSVIYGGWGAPLSTADPAVAERGMAEVRAALECAHAAGADDILLVPAVVNANTRYADAYKRSQERIRQLIPDAERLKVLILVENVWNYFLLSPMEFARYVDEFRSPWVQAYFDVGNVAAFAWSQDWIRTLGKRIRKVHLKDFKGGPSLGGGGAWAALREGTINWPEVRKALAEVGYNGFLTTEVSGGDEAYLRDLAGRVDKIIAGE